MWCHRPLAVKCVCVVCMVFLSSKLYLSNSAPDLFTIFHSSKKQYDIPSGMIWPIDWWNSKLRKHTYYPAHHSNTTDKNVKERTMVSELLPHAKGKVTPQKVLIFTKFRSGSSFIGDLFSHHKEVFYVFEPFKLYRGIDRHTEVKRMLHILKNVFDCHTSKPKHKLDKWLKNIWFEAFCQSRYLMNRWKRKGYGLYCDEGFKLDNLPRLCQSRKHVVTKVIRLANVSVVERLLEKGIKVIHLVRDPRARITSIKSLKKYHDINKLIKETCTDLDRTLEDVKRLVTSRPSLVHHYHLVRYEDVALNPIFMTQRLYTVVGIDLKPEIINWVVKSTQVRGDNDPYSTRRNSSAVVKAWTRHLGWEDVEAIQGSCATVLQTLGYGVMRSPSDLENKDPLLPFPSSNNVLSRCYLG